MKTIPRGAPHIIRSTRFDNGIIEGDDINPTHKITASKQWFEAKYIVIPPGQKTGSATTNYGFVPSTYKINSPTIDSTARYINRATFNSGTYVFTIELNANATEEQVILVTFINRAYIDILEGG